MLALITPIIIMYAKLVLSSALMMAFYWFVLRGRASYLLTRFYLLSIPFLSVIVSKFSFEVYTPDKVYVQVQAEQATENASGEAATDVVNTVVGESQNFFGMERLSQFVSETNFVDIIQYLILAVSIVLISIATYCILRMFVLSRTMKREYSDNGYAIVHSEDIKSPFSFADTVFMPQGLTAKDEDLILRHEMAHVKHKHYLDVWTIELMTRMLWFNPFLWLTRSELRNVHEFEADNDVIKSGADVLTYQTLLLEEVLDDSSTLANGFNHSFIRRRFIEMKQSAVGTLGKLGKFSTVLCVIFTFCLFTFSIGKAETVYLYGSGQESNVSGKADNVSENMTLESEMEQASEVATVADVTPTAVLDKNIPCVTDLPLNTNAKFQYSGLYMEKHDNETYVICVGTCESDDELLTVGGRDAYIEDVDSGDLYKVRRSLTPDCWNQVRVLNMKGKTFAVTLVFPPLPDHVKHIKFHHICSWLDMRDKTRNIESYLSN